MSNSQKGDNSIFLDKLESNSILNAYNIFLYRTEKHTVVYTEYTLSNLRRVYDFSLKYQ